MNLRAPFSLLLLLVILFSLPSQSSFSQAPEYQLHTFYSENLQRNMNYAIYLPKEYHQLMDKRFPVIYALHGWGGNEFDWFEKGMIDKVMLDLYERGEIKQKYIIVCPQGDNSLYLDWRNGERYSSYISEDLIMYIDETYRTTGFRAILGLSMGGFGALSIAFRNPQKFQVVCSHSGALFKSPVAFLLDNLDNLEFLIQDNEKEIEGFIQRITGGSIVLVLINLPLFIRDLQRENPLNLVQDLSERDDVPAIYSDCGDNDLFEFYKGAEKLHELLIEEGIPHEYRIFDGNHDWGYWQKAIYSSLRFIDGNV